MSGRREREREKERQRKREKGKMFILTCDNYDVYSGIQKQAERRGERWCGSWARANINKNLENSSNDRPSHQKLTTSSKSAPSSQDLHSMNPWWQSTVNLILYPVETRIKSIPMDTCHVNWIRTCSPQGISAPRFS